MTARPKMITVSLNILDAIVRLLPTIFLIISNKKNDNKKMQHSCGVTHSIALSYQFQNTTILVNLFQLGLH